MMPKKTQPTREELRKVEMAQDLVHTSWGWLSAVQHLFKDYPELDEAMGKLYQLDHDLFGFHYRFLNAADYDDE